GVRPVINATGGNRTLLGGSILSTKVSRAMQVANRYYVDMKELLDRTGEIIAELLSCEAAHVTPGCCAALALGTAACIAGDDPGMIERLPEVKGVRHEVIIQKGLRNKYDRCVTVSGATLVEVGEESGTSPEQIEAAIGDKTAAIHYLAPGGREGVVPLEQVIAIGRRHQVPIMVDAAGQVYPVENLSKYTAMGADLVGYGAKYFGGPNSTGILCGRKDLVEAAALHGFIGFESTVHRSFGRPMKLDRQEIIAVVVALREWLTMDHQARFLTYERRVANLQRELEGVPGIQVVPEGSPVTGLLVRVDEKAFGRTIADIAEALREGDPSIWVRSREDAITLSVKTIVDGDELVIADRLKSLLSG
ncbi:MAG: aminotransferase class V-fold PLP-dependent enzyme, partial [Anaerolineales bacterium]